MVHKNSQLFLSKDFLFNKLPLLGITVFTTWMLAKLSITLSALYNIFWKCLPNFIIYGLLFAFAGISRNKKLALWLLQLLQMICFGNSYLEKQDPGSFPNILRIHHRNTQLGIICLCSTGVFSSFLLLFFFFMLDWKHRSAMSFHAFPALNKEFGFLSCGNENKI